MEGGRGRVKTDDEMNFTSPVLGNKKKKIKVFLFFPYLYYYITYEPYGGENVYVVQYAHDSSAKVATGGFVHTFIYIYVRLVNLVAQV